MNVLECQLSPKFFSFDNTRTYEKLVRFSYVLVLYSFEFVCQSNILFYRKHFCVLTIELIRERLTSFACLIVCFIPKVKLNMAVAGLILSP